MSHKALVVEKKEYVLVKRCINRLRFNQDKTLQQILDRLSHELENADICSEDEMPRNTVRLDSMVTIISTDDQKESFQLILPNNKGFKENKVSLFDPKGASVFGRKEGDYIRFNGSTVKGIYKIMIVRQQNKNISLDMVL